MALHSHGKTAALAGAISRDIYEDSGVGDLTNVEGIEETATKSMMALAQKFLEPYASRYKGLASTDLPIGNAVREMFGKDTGDDAAKAAAAGWKAAVEYGLGRVKRAGVRISVLEDWRLPQPWSTVRVRKFTQNEFTDDLMREFEGGTLRVMDKAGFGDAPRGAVGGIIANAYTDIKLGRGGSGGGGGFTNQLRVFRFNDPDAWLRVMGKYGPGDAGLYGMMAGHMQGMAREIALSEMFGPRHGDTFARLLKEAQEDETERSLPKITDGMSVGQKRLAAVKAKAGNLNPLHWGFTSSRAVNAMYQQLSGQLSAVEGNLTAGFWGGLRNIVTSARLGASIVSAVPGDSVTGILAARHNGIAPIALLTRNLTDIATAGAHSRELAAQLELTSSAVLDSVVFAKRFEDNIVGDRFGGRLATFMARVTGLQAWTEMSKRTFSIEFMGALARETKKTFDGANAGLGGFLGRYSITPAEWDELRSMPLLSVNGARFFDPTSVANQKLKDKLLSAVIDERHFAVVEPDARVRQFTTAGTARGTAGGEVVRTLTMFKSFPVAMMLTHLTRNLTQGTPWQRAHRTAFYLTSMTVAGAVAQQASSLLTGKDPAPMDDPRFWISAFMRGGGAGFYGDFIYSAQTRGDSGVYEFAAGPTLGPIIGAGADTLQGNMDGAAFARLVKQFTPLSSVWYTRLATDRLIFDQLQMLVDPDYQKSFARQEKRIQKDFGQRSWWRRGRAVPERAPDLTRILGS